MLHSFNYFAGGFLSPISLWHKGTFLMSEIPWEPCRFSRARHSFIISNDRAKKTMKDQNQSTYWQETGRWGGYEECFDPQSGVWASSHISYLTFKSLIQLRRTMNTGQWAWRCRWKLILGFWISQSVIWVCCLFKTLCKTLLHHFSNHLTPSSATFFQVWRFSTAKRRALRASQRRWCLRWSARKRSGPKTGTESWSLCSKTPGTLRPNSQPDRVKEHMCVIWKPRSGIRADHCLFLDIQN